MRERLDDVVVPQLRERISFIALERGVLRSDGYCLLLAQADREIEIPVGMAVVLLLEPGLSVTHEAVHLAAEHGTLLLWVGEAGVRVYSSGFPGGRHHARLLRQAEIHLDPEKRLRIAGRFYVAMFGEAPPETRSLEKLRGWEGAKIKGWYAEIARSHDVPWTGRQNADRQLQSALGFATSCLYGICETVILAAGYSPAIGIIHSGDQRSLVFDLADTIKFHTVIPAAFEVYRSSPDDIRGRVRRRCRDLFREQHTIERLFDILLEVMETPC